MILADTSAWAEYDRATGSTVDTRLTDLIGASRPVAVTEPIVMEVVAGARSQQCETDLRRLLQRFQMLAFEPTIDFDTAATIYRRCRHSGVTPRGMIDCMIASVAWRNNATILSHDLDLYRVAQVLGLRLDKASLTA